LRDFCFINDVVAGILLALESTDVDGEVFNLASGDPISIHDMIEKVQQCIGSGTPNYGEVPFRKDENQALVADITKAKELLNWSPTTPVDEGIRKTINAYRSSFEMEHKPLVSIIMNCYNSERFLREAIDSVYAQTYKNWEIIFWDNASEDKSSEIAQSYDSKIKYFHAHSTTPLGEARNLALQKANGTYIAFLDCDDLYEPNKLQMQIDLMENNDYAMCYGSVITIYEDGRVKKQTHVTNKSGFLLGHMLNKYEINMQSVLIRRSVLEESKLEFPINLKYCPDYNLFMNILALSPVGVIQDFIVRYRIVENSLSRETVDLVSGEMKYTLDELVELNQELHNKYAAEFTTAYQKLHYYDAIAALYHSNKKLSRQKLKPVIFNRLSYFAIYLLLLSPLSSQKILRILGR
jgi:glycosyltransferase involved in cell wall biosynthesis